MRDVWISPALPADRSALAAQLPPELALCDTATPPPDAIVVVSGYETERIRTLSFRDPGTALVVICAPDAPAQARVEGRQPEVLTTATTVGEVAQAIRQAATATGEAPWWVSPPAAEQPTATTWLPGAVADTSPAEPRSRWQRHRAALLSATAIVLALLIGIVVVVSDKNDSSAAATNPAGNPTTLQPGTGTNPFGAGGQGFGGTGTIPGQGSGSTGSDPQGSTGTTPQGSTGTDPQGSTGTSPQGSTGTVPQNGTGSGSQGTGSQGGGFGAGGFGSGSGRGLARDFVTCLRNNGIDISSGSLGQLNLSDPALRSALEKCAQQAAGGSSGTGVPAPATSPAGTTKTT